MAGYVLLPQPIEEAALRLLEGSGLECVLAESTRTETVRPLMRGARAVVLRTGLRMTAELIREAEELHTISRTGAGFDNVDIEAATSHGIIVTSGMGVNTNSVAEHALALMLALFKQLFLMDRELRAGNFGIRYQNHPRDLRYKVLGVVGFGKIGATLAEKCFRLLGMRVCAYDPYVSEETKRACAKWVELTDLRHLFQHADVVSIHVPLTEGTRHLVDGQLLGLMKRDAFVVNTSRGGVVNEDDLIRMLKERRIAGAGLDVFENEPPFPESELLELENVILTPHAAALTRECVVEMAVSAVRRVLDVLEGRRPENVANPEVLSHPRWRMLRG